MFKRRIEAKVVNPLLGHSIPAPTYATDGSAAMDLRACVEGVVTIPPGGRRLVETGIAINMMDVVKKNGDKINVAKLAEKLGCPVVEISALKLTGIENATRKAMPTSWRVNCRSVRWCLLVR